MGLHFAQLISYSITSPEASLLLFDCIVCNSRPARRWHARTEPAAPREAALPPRQPLWSRHAPTLPPPAPLSPTAGDPLPSSCRDVTCPQVFSSDGGFPPFPSQVGAAPPATRICSRSVPRCAGSRDRCSPRRVAARLAEQPRHDQPAPVPGGKSLEVFKQQRHTGGLEHPGTGCGTSRCRRLLHLGEIWACPAPAAAPRIAGAGAAGPTAHGEQASTGHR